MGPWLSAEHRHRRYLQAFTCAAEPWRRLKKRRIRHGEWASRVQGMIRSIEPPLREPEFLKLRVHENTGRVEAATWFAVDAHGAKSEVVVGALGVCTEMQGRKTLGAEGLDTVARTAFEWTIAHAPDAQQISIVAQVHRDNVNCKKLIARHGWVFTEMDPDGVHEIWGAVARIE